MHSSLPVWYRQFAHAFSVLAQRASICVARGARSFSPDAIRRLLLAQSNRYALSQLSGPIDIDGLEVELARSAGESCRRLGRSLAPTNRTPATRVTVSRQSSNRSSTRRVPPTGTWPDSERFDPAARRLRVPGCEWCAESVAGGKTGTPRGVSGEGRSGEAMTSYGKIPSCS